MQDFHAIPQYNMSEVVLMGYHVEIYIVDCTKNQGYL